GASDAMLDGIMRTDGRARKIMVETLLAGKISDQRAIVEHARVPLALVNGEDEPFTNPDYLASLSVPTLWERKPHRLPGLGHAPFWQSPETFNPILLRFLRDVSRHARD